MFHCLYYFTYNHLLVCLIVCIIFYFKGLSMALQVMDSLNWKTCQSKYTINLTFVIYFFNAYYYFYKSVIHFYQ